MWKCQTCGERIEDTLEACRSCGTGKDGSPPENPTAFKSSTNQQQSTSELEEYFCDGCGTTVKYEDNICPKCGADISDVKTSSGFVASLSRRYSDAYTEAHTVVTIGKTIKGIAVFLSFVIFVGSAIAFYKQFGGNVQYIIGSAILACIVGVPIYILGILIGSQGQTSLAMLDTAVNSSRHLSDDEVAKIFRKRWSM